MEPQSNDAKAANALGPGHVFQPNEARVMKIVRLAASALLVGAGMWGPGSQAFEPLDPAAEQIALTILQQCGGAIDESTPPCSTSVLMDADGTHVIPVPGGDDRAWSPDGRRLLGVRNGEIFLDSVTGAAITNLTNHPAYDWTPAWSPDGSRIAFASDRDGPLALYVMNADGSDVVRLATGGVGTAWHPTWSPDSQRLAFTCIVGPPQTPWWQADMSSADICAMNVDGSAFAQLTSEPGADSSPTWSPNGARIVFVTSRFGGAELALMVPDGTGMTRVSPGTPADDPKWSSDSTRIAFVSWDPETIGWTLWSFVSVINADGTGLSSLAPARSPAWRPWQSGANDRPVASFTFECNGLTCALDGSASSDSDGTIIEYGWRFDDGTSASGAIVSHTFKGGRAYDVRLVVMDNGGALATAARTLDLNLPPVVTFTATCSGLTCMFDGTGSSDPDGTIASFSWRFGDYTDSPGPATITHTYAAAGTYTVMLTATDGTATGSQIQTVSVGNVNAPPVATFTVVCIGMTCSFDASGSRDPDGIVTGYAWNFGDAASGSGVTAKRTYAAPGTYRVTLDVTDSGGATSPYARSVTVVVPELHVGDLDGASAIAQNTWTATVTITVHDGSHGLLSTAAVTGSWSDGSSGSCITDGSGLCVVSKSGISRKTVSASFAVTNVAMPASAYQSTRNHDSDGDSNGTAITVRKP